MGLRVVRLLNRNIRGKIFCQVESRRQRCQLRPDITLGNQKWSGAAPAFIISPEITRSLGRSMGRLVELTHEAPVSRRRDPKVWVRKYFVAASYSLLLGVLTISGIKAKRLSSIPIYIVTQFVAERAINVPDKVVRKKSELDHFRLDISLI